MSGEDQPNGDGMRERIPHGQNGGADGDAESIQELKKKEKTVGRTPDGTGGLSHCLASSTLEVIVWSQEN